MSERKKISFLEEKIKKIDSTEILYPNTEIKQILNPNNKIIIINGKYGSGKSTIIESIPNDKTKIINISLLEDNLKYFKFNIYNKIKQKNSWFKKYYLSIIFILIIIFFLITLGLHLVYDSFVTDVLFKTSSILMNSIFSVILLIFLFNFKIVKFLKKYESNNQEYFLYDIDYKIIKKMNKKNIIIAIEDIDRIEERKITEFISLLNSLITKITKQLVNSNSKLILTMDLVNISEENLSLLNKSNYFIVNTTIHTNFYLCTWAADNMKEYLDSTSEDIFLNFSSILTIREFKKIIKDSIQELNFFKESKFLSIFYKNFISFNFFLLKSLLIFSFKKENILNKKINWLFKKDYTNEINLYEKNKKDILNEYINWNFRDLPLFLQELILDNIYLKKIGSISISQGFNYFNFYFLNKLDYAPNESKLNSFLKIIEEKYKNITSPGVYYISITLKKELLNLDTDFTNFDNIYKNLISEIRNSFNDNKTNEFISLIKNITNSDLKKDLVGIDFYIKNKFNHYLNSNKSYSFSNQIIYQKISSKINNKDYLKYFKEIIKLNTPIYIDWTIINENMYLQNLLLSEQFNYNLNKRFWISISKLIFEIINLNPFTNDEKQFLTLLTKKEFIDFKEKFIELYNSKLLATFFNSIVKLFYLDKTKFGLEYYNKIIKIIKEKRKEIDINKIYNEYGKINYLFWPWHFIISESNWIIEHFTNKLISRKKMKFIYDEISANLYKLEEKNQQKTKEKMNFIIDKLNLNFKKL